MHNHLPLRKLVSKLSDMETDGPRHSLREQLHEIERGESASWVVYPPTPRWWAVAFGGWAATLALVIGLLDGAVQSMVQLALVLVLCLMVAWDRRRRGSYPSGRPPRELHRAMLSLALGSTVVAGLAWGVGEQVGVGAAAAVAGAGGYAVVAWYEHQYAAAAARIRERLG